MKKSLIFLLVITGLYSIIFAQKNFTEQIFVPLSYPEKPGFLIVEHFKGSITVTGYEGDVVTVKASLRGHTETGVNVKETDGMKLIPSHEIELSAQEKNNTVTVFSGSHRKTIDLEINVPKEFSLKLNTVYNGKIIVSNVSGEFEISNINGDINMVNVSGSAILNTVDGNIETEFLKVTDGTPMAFTSIYGNVDVMFPGDVKISVKMKSDNGNIYSDFDYKMENRKTDLSLKTSEKVIYPEKWTYGKINGGGAEILLKSFDGNIYLRKTG